MTDNRVNQAKLFFIEMRLWIGCLAISTTLLCLLYVGFEPRWETNDDVAMAMAAGGYGLAASATPNLVFSNVLWGYLTLLMPDIGWTVGYSVATIAVLLGVGTIIAHNLVRLGVSLVCAILIIALIMPRPMLHPQFTINAGLLMVAAVTCWHLYQRHDQKWPLLIGCLLAFLSYLVRGLEFALVLAVATPLLPWRALLTRRAGKVAAMGLVAAIAAAAVIDQYAYQGAEWANFSELNKARAPYTDFNAATRLKQRPDIMEQYRYSVNDVDLIGNWFYVDKAIAEPTALNAMLKELGPVPSQDIALTNVWAGMQVFRDPKLFPLFLAALLLALLHPGWRIAAVWILCVGAVLAMALAGRPGVARVCLPLACLLVVSPFLAGKPTSLWWSADRRQRLGAFVLLLTAAFNTSFVFSDSRRLHAIAQSARAGMAEFPVEPVIVWGGAFPFQAMYPFLGQPPTAPRFQLYGLGVLTWAPYTVSFSEANKGQDMIARLVSYEGVPIIWRERHVGLLREYCREHLQVTLEVLAERRVEDMIIGTIRCMPV